MLQSCCSKMLFEDACLCNPISLFRFTLVHVTPWNFMDGYTLAYTYPYIHIYIYTSTPSEKCYMAHRISMYEHIANRVPVPKSTSNEWWARWNQQISTKTSTSQPYKWEGRTQPVCPTKWKVPSKPGQWQRVMNTRPCDSQPICLLAGLPFTEDTKPASE